MPRYPERRPMITRSAMIRDDANLLHKVQEIECHKCGTLGHINIGATLTALPDGIAVKKFQQAGWEVRGGRAYCPEHSRHRKQDDAATGLPDEFMVQPVIDGPSNQVILTVVPTIQPEEPVMAEPARLSDLATIALPDRAMKRSIVETIQGNWDDGSARYIGDASDQSIATELKCPRKWVEDIRVDLFGDNGGNEELDALKRDIAIALGDAEKLVNSSLDLANKYDDQFKSLKELQRRLERVERQVLPKR